MLSKIIKYLFLVAIVLVQVIIVWKLNYPPTTEQLLFGLTNFTQLWLLRLGSLALVIASIYIFSTFISTRLKWLIWLLVLISPAILVGWMGYPLATLKFFVLSGIVFLSSQKKINLWLAIGISTLFLVTSNLKVLKQSPTFLSLLSLKTSQQEVITRITT